MGVHVQMCTCKPQEFDDEMLKQVESKRNAKKAANKDSAANVDIQEAA